MPAHDSDLSQIVYEANRTAPEIKSDKTASLDKLLALAVEQGASDVILVAGAPVAFRINGSLVLATGKALSADELRTHAPPAAQRRPIQRRLETSRALDFCFVRGSIGRFRANLHYQRGTLAASIRLLPAQIPTIESLHLPPVLGRLTERPQGLVLLTGPTGCGKTSTLAALIDIINTRRSDHIVTIEDPVEYQHVNRNSIVEQIEVGHDTPLSPRPSAQSCARSPDVILVGEMRDPETMAAALTAAETGHLVLSTLHTNDATQTMSPNPRRFPAGNQAQIRQQLSLALLAVVAQQLVPAIGNTGLYPAVEIMIATTAIRNLIRTGQDHQMRSLISTGKSEGMMTMDQSLAELVQTRRIDRDTALAHCYHPDELRSHLIHPA